MPLLIPGSAVAALGFGLGGLGLLDWRGQVPVAGVGSSIGFQCQPCVEDHAPVLWLISEGAAGAKVSHLSWRLPGTRYTAGLKLSMVVSSSNSILNSKKCLVLPLRAGRATFSRWLWPLWPCGCWMAGTLMGR